MKLIMSVVQDQDTMKLTQALVASGFRATKLASTGGFLRAGNTTMFVGVEDHQVDEVMKIIDRVCRSREQLASPVTPVGGPMESYVPYPVEVTVGGATVFVLNVERFEKL